MKYTFESATKTLLETDNYEELNAYIQNNNIVLEMDGDVIKETFNCIHLYFYGYVLIIKK